jgi:hypothetical protein
MSYAIGDRVFDYRNINQFEVTERASAASGVVTAVNNTSVDVRKQSGESVTIPLEYVMPESFINPT